MKKCPECGIDLPEDIAYCLYCGTRTDVSKLIKYNRRIFFLSPIFFLLICLGLTFDLGSANYLEYGIALAGIIIGIYYFGALLLGVFTIFSRSKLAPNSFFQAGFTAIINIITTFFCVFAIENIYLEDFFYKSGPTLIVQNHIILVVSMFLLVQVIMTLAILLKARVFNNPQLFKNITIKRLYSDSHYWLVFIFVIVTITGVYYTKNSDKIALISEYLIRISAKEKAALLLDNGLKKYPDSAKLYYLKASLLTESEDQILSTLTPEVEAEALSLAEKAATLKPFSPLYKYYLSIQLEINKDYNQAVRLASEAATLAKTDVYLWLNLGNLNLKRYNYKDAIIAYKEAVKLDPKNASALNNLAYVLLLNEQDYPIALKLAQEANEILPNSVSLIDTLAWAYYKNNYLPEALENINRLYEKQNELMPEIDFHRAAILDGMDLLSKPVETYDKMIVKPEVAINRSLVSQIIEARKKAQAKQSLEKRDKR